MSKYKALFVEESREHLSELSRLLVAVEASPDPARLIGEVFRHAHSLKGMSASMGYTDISTLAHRMEDVVDRQRHAGSTVPKHVVDLLLHTVDALTAQIDVVSEDGTPPAHPDLVAALVSETQNPTPAQAVEPVAALPQTPTAEPKTVVPATEGLVVRVRLSATAPSPAARAFLVYRRLGNIGNVVEAQPSLAEIKAGDLASSELRLALTGASETAIHQALAAISDIEQVTVVAAQPVDHPKTPRPAGDVGDGAKSATTIRVRTDVLDTLIDSVGELFIARERLAMLLGHVQRPDVRAALDALSARVREIHGQVMAVRMMPLRTLTDRYPRLVRDLARALGKDVELVVQGSDLELDRGILDHLDAVFVHTLRNAVDHGIEAKAERLAARKSAQGKITIVAARDRDMVIVTIEDDGRGLDPALLRQTALAKGLISLAESEQLTTRDSYFLVCLPGFSTKSEVSDVSGRGVGMDAVRSRIESLGGTLDIDSAPGLNTRFFVRLPLTLAIIPVLLVEAEATVFAIPIAKVVSIREKGTDVIHQPGGVVYLSFQHALVPVIDLSDLLRLRALPGGSEFVVVVEDGRDLFGLGVDRVVGYSEAVVKPLGEPLDRLEWFSGAAILGDGQPILILDVARTLRKRSTVP